MDHHALVEVEVEVEVDDAAKVLDEVPIIPVCQNIPLLEVPVRRSNRGGDEFYFSLFFSACKESTLRPPIISILESRPNMIDERYSGGTTDGYTGLNSASKKGRESVISELLSRDANCQISGIYDGNSPLHWTCFYGFTLLSMKMVAKGANLFAANKNGFTPIELIGLHYSKDKAFKWNQFDILSAKTDLLAARVARNWEARRHYLIFLLRGGYIQSAARQREISSEQESVVHAGPLYISRDWACVFSVKELSEIIAGYI